jgi:hypothetical protein
MAAALKNIVVERGATFSFPFLVRNTDDNSVFDLTGFTGQAQVRETPQGKLIADMACPITVGTGLVSPTIDPDDTVVLRLGIFHWDLFIRSSTRSIRLLQGQAKVVDTVSRE